MRRLGWVLAAAVGGLAGAAPAHAATYCVNDPACPAGGSAQPSLTAALALANAAGGPDTVRVGPGTYSGNPDAATGTTLIGAGRTATIIDGSLGTDTGGSASDMLVRMPPNEIAGAGGNGLFTRVDIDGSAPGPDNATGWDFGIRPGKVVDSKVTMSHGSGLVGGHVDAYHMDITAPTAVKQDSYPTTLHDSVLRANVGIEARSGTLDADNVVIIAQGDDPVGVLMESNGPGGADVTLTHATLLSPHHVGAAIQSVAGGIRLKDVAFCGWGTQLDRKSIDRVATITADYIAYDPSEIVATGPGAITVTHPVISADTRTAQR